MIKKTILTLLMGITVATTSISVYASENPKKVIINGSSKKISRELNEKAFKKADEAILINEDASIDAISATPLAYAKNAPIIPTSWKDMSKSTLDYIEDLGVKKITIIGGLKNVSKTIERDLTKKGIEVKRIYGDDRYETSKKIAKEMQKEVKVSKAVLMSSTSGLENAIAISDFACKNNMPILWGKDDALKDTIKFINKQDYKEIYAVGNSERFTHDVEEGIENVNLVKEINKYETNIDSIKEDHKDKDIDTIYTVNMDYGNYADITKYLSLPVVAAKEDIPILVCNENFTYSQEKFIEQNVDKIIEVGEEVGAYSIINILKGKSFIRVSILILLLIAIIIRGFKA